MEVLCIIAVIAIAMALVSRRSDARDRWLRSQLHARREEIICAQTCTGCGASWPGLKMVRGVTPPVCTLCDLRKGCGSCKKTVCAYDCATPRCGECAFVGHGVRLVPNLETPHFGDTYRCAECRPEEDL